VLAWAVERLQTDVGIRAEVDSLDYNLLALCQSGRNATLTAAAAETPFFPGVLNCQTQLRKTVQPPQPASRLIKPSDG
jgi:hypothetical protein